VPNLIVSTEIDGEYVDVGDLLFNPGRHDSHVARFTYDTDFIRRGWPIDPAIGLDDAAHDLRGLPLAIEDAAPDSWGQMLLQRAERHAAGVEGRGATQLTPDRYLLAASDATRQGALRFRSEQDGPFLGEDGTVPKTLEIATLLSAADEAAADSSSPDWRAVEQLLEAGASALGGARPKAAVLDEMGLLWLAKFPRPGDGNNVPVWEMVALDVAERAGLHVPSRQLLAVAGRQVLLVRRFDREDDGTRRHYISTRTLLGARDLGRVADYGQRRGIAGRLARESSDPTTDLRLLWKQAALNLLINNTDNHLRNHGLLRGGGAWRLAPVFDLDPNPDTGTQFNTLFGGAAYRRTALRGLLSIARDCGLDDEQARTALAEVHEAVPGWDTDARGYGASESEVGLLADAFTGLDGEVKKALSAS
jgi:serine/threonine-protein kinase HipA